MSPVLLGTVMPGEAYQQYAPAEQIPNCDHWIWPSGKAHNSFSGISSKDRIRPV